MGDHCQGAPEQGPKLCKKIFQGQAPDEPNILHGKIKKCAHMMGEPRDKSMVEVDKQMTAPPSC
jgi:hypothetical protein